MADRDPTAKTVASIIGGAQATCGNVEADRRNGRMRPHQHASGPGGYRYGPGDPATNL